MATTVDQLYDDLALARRIGVEQAAELARWAAEYRALKEVSERLRREVAELREERATLRAALIRYVNSDDCEYADGQPDTCPGDPPYVDVCHWHEGRAALRSGAAAPGAGEGPKTGEAS